MILAAPASALRGQTVSGTVLEEGSDFPVDGAMVLLFDAEGALVRRVLTDGAGRFAVDAGAPGRYSLRVDRIGYESVSIGSFDVGPDGARQTVRVPIHVIRLEGLDVQGSRRCEVRPEEGRATALLWQEARKALEAASWTLSEGVYRYTLLHFTRDLDLNGIRVLDEQRSFYRGRARAPYVSLPAEQLVAEGFVHTLEDGRQSYYAPDADVLLSDAFLDTHCMRLVEGDEGRIGLRLEPVSGRRLPDIEGTLWMDAATARLQRLEFRYVHLRGSPRLNGELGGEVVFGGLPNGTWVVREWWIRMPRLAQRGPDGPLSRIGYQDMGGVVWRVTDRDGTQLLEATTATVAGLVVDSTGVRPLAGVRVRADLPTAGSRIEDVSRPDGSFFLGGLPGGTHTLRLYHPSLDTLGLGAPPAAVRATVGDAARTRLTLPSPTQLLTDVCGGAARPPGTAILYGRVLDASRRPIADLPLRLIPLSDRPDDYELPPRAAPEREGQTSRSWTPAVAGGTTVLEGATDAAGSFILCDIPTPAQVRVVLDRGTPEEESRTVHLTGDAAVTTTTLVRGERRDW